VDEMRRVAREHRVPKVLIVSNDFPPRRGGIQSFVHALACRMPAGSVVVYAPSWEGAAEFDANQPFPVIRHPTSLMLPVPSVARRAARILREHKCDTVLFGAAAPLALLAPSLRRAGAGRLVAITHGHEAGWAVLPVARGLLRRIGNQTDVVTYLGEYFRMRLTRALSPAAAARMERLAPGVDTSTFRPGPGGDEIRERHDLGDRPVVVCVSRLVRRKGQDTLIRGWPQVLATAAGQTGAAGRPTETENRPGGPRAAGNHTPVLLIVGDGPYRGELERLAEQTGVADSVVFTWPVPAADLPAYYRAGNVFAMPCRTRRGGLDVEGLGIVYLEASASGLPVVGGDSGGAPDAILDGETGYVVPGRDAAAAARRISELLADPAGAAALGEKGVAWVDREWRWELIAERLWQILAG
jgi:phosphatidyl-myo-inositol dimannoside synthase